MKDSKSVIWDGIKMLWCHNCLARTKHLYKEKSALGAHYVCALCTHPNLCTLGN